MAIASTVNREVLRGRFVVFLALLVFLTPIAPIASAQTAQTAPKADEKQATAEEIGKAIDAQLGKLRAAIASNDESKVVSYVKAYFPMVADETDAKLSEYVAAAKGKQVRGGKGSAGLNSCIASLMATSGYSGYVADGLNFATLGDISVLGGTVDGTLNNLGDLAVVG